MRIAVLSLTRDRLEYSQHCFGKLHLLAGCEYDHYVLDQGSQDDTPRWLRNGTFHHVTLLKENVGISRGMNLLLDEIGDGYDVVVKIDNDCELTEHDTLRRVAEVTLAGGAFLSPRILGLNNPPPVVGEFTIGDDVIEDVPQIGGIFLSVPASWYERYRYPEDGPAWGMDDADICRTFRASGGRCGYVRGLTANHYESTSGQWERYPEYFKRTLQEGKPSL